MIEDSLDRRTPTALRGVSTPQGDAYRPLILIGRPARFRQRENSHSPKGPQAHSVFRRGISALTQFGAACSFSAYQSGLKQIDLAFGRSNGEGNDGSAQARKAAKTVMNVRSAEGAFVTAIARRRSNQLRSRTSALAHRDILRCRTHWVAIGAKLTWPSSHRRPVL